jgi:hypothetical protein
MPKRRWHFYQSRHEQYSHRPGLHGERRRKNAGHGGSRGNFPCASQSTLNIELGCNSQGVNFEILHVTGTATLAGNVNATLVNRFSPTNNTVFAFLTAVRARPRPPSSRRPFTGPTINSNSQSAVNQALPIYYRFPPTSPRVLGYQFT